MFVILMKFDVDCIASARKRVAENGRAFWRESSLDCIRQQEPIMKRTILMSSLAAALAFGSLAAWAQTPPTDSTEAATSPARASHTDPSDPSKGQELVGDQAQQPASPPATIGQDKAAGNDMVAEKSGSKMLAENERPPFETLDTQKQGYVTMDDVKNYAWLSKNFVRCDTSQDGHLTAEEYAACMK